MMHDINGNNFSCASIENKDHEMTGIHCETDDETANFPELESSEKSPAANNEFNHNRKIDSRAKGIYVSPRNISVLKKDVGVFCQDTSSQSGTESLGSPCTVNSPAMNIKCFYGASGLKLHELRNKPREVIRSRLSDNSKKVSVKNMRNGKISSRKHQRTQKQKQGSKIKKASTVSVEKVEYRVVSGSNDVKRMKIDSSVNENSNLETAIDATTEPGVHACFPIPGSMKNGASKHALGTSSPLFESSVESENSNLRCNVRVLVDRICRKYEGLNNEQIPIDIQNQSSDESSTCSSTPEGCFPNEETKLICDENSCSLADDNIDNNLKSCFGVAYQSSAELKESFEDTELDRSDSEDDVDLSLCSFIDASNSVSGGLTSSSQTEGASPSDKNATELVQASPHANTMLKDEQIIDFSSSCDYSLNEHSNEVVSQSASDNRLDRSLTNSPSEIGGNNPLSVVKNGCDTIFDIEEKKVENAIELKQFDEIEVNSCATENKADQNKLRQINDRTTLLGYFQRKSEPNKQKNVGVKMSKYIKKNDDETVQVSSIKSEEKHFYQMPLCKTQSSAIEMTIEDFASSSRPTSPKTEYCAKAVLSVNGKQQKKKLCRSPKTVSKKMEQLYIDVGQRDFGHTACPTCGMVYTKTLEEDSLQHAKYHQKLMQKLKFKGWKTERVLQEFHDGRIIQVNPEDNNLHQKKVSELREIVDRELGFSYPTTVYTEQEKVFLFISNKKIVGCAITVPIDKAYPVIPTNNISTPEKKQGLPTLSWCCSSKPVAALCGISRIWVLKQARRQNVASRLIDAVRNNFIYGVVISKAKLAFSDPTPDGRLFAEKYSETQNILVFR